MVDYIEGVLNMRQKLYELEKALLNKKIMDARTLCAQLSTEARMIYQQLAVQFPEETGHVVQIRSQL
jgi:hypothetical protein